MIKNLCVFCGSRTGNRPEYAEEALKLAGLLCERKITLVYGGGNVGLMGVIANEVMRLNGKVIGIIPGHLMKREAASIEVTDLIVTHSMHERKARMAEIADAFIAMPGGIGTLDELFEIWTWSQLGLHSKPLGLLNTQNYFDHMIKLISQMVNEGFLSEIIKDRLAISDNAEEILNHLTNIK